MIVRLYDKLSKVNGRAVTLPSCHAFVFVKHDPESGWNNGALLPQLAQYDGRRSPKGVIFIPTNVAWERCG
jgi:hypothetical protein